ncbi:MAG TPA: hypothetical protein VEY30_03190 [Myxococcaceae bacterium]|nr:hypothetical protein [Myxococcaceae bacterium]
MRLGVDWVSLGLVLAAYALSQVRTLSLRLRYGGMAVAFAIMAVARVRLGLAGVNGILTGIVAGLAAYYAYRSATSR